MLRRNFIDYRDLPEHMQDLRPGFLDDVISNLQYRFILEQLNLMASPRGTEIWYENSRFIWQLAQGQIDWLAEQEDQFRLAARSDKRKIDRRNWHGRPRNQARRRGTLPGASISYPPK